MIIQLRNSLADSDIELTEDNFPDAEVACGSCTLCCKQTMVAILAEDRQNFYLTVDKMTPHGQVSYLQQQANGDCIYLQNDQCSIHGQHPIMCRKFSCINLFKFYPRWRRREMIKNGEVSKEIIARGRELANLPDLVK